VALNGVFGMGIYSDTLGTTARSCLRKRLLEDSMERSFVQAFPSLAVSDVWFSLHKDLADGQNPSLLISETSWQPSLVSAC